MGGDYTGFCDLTQMPLPIEEMKLRERNT